MASHNTLELTGSLDAVGVCINMLRNNLLKAHYRAYVSIHFGGFYFKSSYAFFFCASNWLYNYFIYFVNPHRSFEELCFLNILKHKKNK